MQKARHHPFKNFFKKPLSIILLFSAVVLIVGLLAANSGDSASNSNNNNNNNNSDSTVNNGSTDNGNSGNVITNDVDLFSSQTLSGFMEFPDEFPGCYVNTFPEVIELKEGETYYVEWDGVTYVCEGLRVISEETVYPIVYLGNGSFLGFAGNDEPFAIVYDYEDGNSLAIAFTDSSESHIIRIYQKGIVTLQLKDLTVTQNGTYTASVGEAYSSVNVNVPSTGVVDFPYDLVEILPETELSFTFGASTLFPYTPAAFYADSDTTLNMIENNQILESGDSGIVIWDGVFYAVYSGNRSLPPTAKLDGTPTSGQGFSLNNGVGNIALPKIWDISSDGNRKNLFKISSSHGSSDEPFYIIANAQKKSDFDLDEFGWFLSKK